LLLCAAGLHGSSFYKWFYRVALCLSASSEVARSLVKSKRLARALVELWSPHYGGGVSLQNYAFAIHLMSRGNGIGNPRLAQSLRTKSSFKYAERASVDSTRSTKTQSSSTLTTRVPHARAYRELVKAATSTILSFSSTRPNASTKARPSGPRFLSRVSASMTRSHGVPAAPRTDSGLE